MKYRVPATKKRFHRRIKISIRHDLPLIVRLVDKGLNPATYCLKEIRLSQLSYLSSLKLLADGDSCQLYLPVGAEPLRSTFDGVTTAILKIGGRDVGLIFNDFRSNGGSFGIQNSLRVTKFLELLRHSSLPAIYIANSSGVRLMDGRLVFDSAFGILPELKRFADRNLLVSFALDRCIGLGAVIFANGHFRIALREKGQINLTGPEVFKLFFGSHESFDDAACPERHFEKSLLVQDLVDSKEEGLRRIRNLFLFISRQPTTTLGSLGLCGMGERIDARLLNPSIDRLGAILQDVGEHCFEIFADLTSVVRTYLVSRGGRVFGLFVNPPGHPQNMITSEALTRFLAALELFKRLRLPVVSLLDSPGGDPRVVQGDNNFVGLYVQIINKIIEYDAPKLGIVIGRCFGGATVLGFPKIFGADTVLAVPDAQIGIMHPEIIDCLLQGSPRLAARWAEVKAEQKADLSDLIAQGSIDSLIARDQIGAAIGEFLAGPAGQVHSLIEFPKESTPLSHHRPRTEAK